MREWSRVHSSFWTSADIGELTQDGRMLALYLLTSPHANGLGCYRIGLGALADAVGWDSSRAAAAFADLDRAPPETPLPERYRRAFAVRDPRSGCVVICRWLKFNPLDNPNQVTAASKFWRMAPDGSEVQAILAAAIDQHGGDRCRNRFGNGFDEALERFRKGLAGVPLLAAQKGPIETVPETVAVTVGETVPGTVGVTALREGEKRESNNSYENLDVHTPPSDFPPSGEKPRGAFDWIVTKGNAVVWIGDDDAFALLDAYPHVTDLELEFKRMRIWLDAKKSKRPTEGGALAFVRNWLKRDEPKIGKQGRGAKTAQNAVGRAFANSRYTGSGMGDDDAADDEGRDQNGA